MMLGGAPNLAEAATPAGGGSGSPGPGSAAEWSVTQGCVTSVETHLAHTYAKLGLAGAGARRRLGGLLSTPP
jgi:hypothetical protein